MSKVHLLTPELIAKIAAGETIERPASVVKELVENSLDAGADSLELHVKDAGKTLIRLKDNGSGIDPEDLGKIFQRHTTSKIQNLDDLWAIQSLGFRGEALYSIAAVSDVTFRSRTPNQPTGWEVHLRGGKKLDLKPVAMNSGTEIEIRELFFNTPGRKKFLKTNATELNQILNLFLPYTLIHFQRRFLFSHQDKDLLDLRPAKGLRPRVVSSLNLEEKHLIEGEEDFPGEGISLGLILGDINIQRPRRDLQFIFVNGRPVQNRNLAFHINQAYRLIFPEGVYPFFALLMQVPPQEVDVNIHPTKREVKIKDEQRVAMVVRSLVQKALMDQGKSKQFLSTFQAHPQADNPPWPANAGTWGGQSEIRNPKFLASPSPQYADQHFAFQPTPMAPAESQSPGTAQNESLQNKLSLSRYIGSFLKKYLLFETGTSLFVVDQHAAQERIMYEAFRRQIERSRIEVQQLLTPIVLRLSIPDMLAWQEAQEKLKTIGLETTQWDKESIALHTHPQLIKNPELTIRDLLAGGDVASFDHDSIARRACRASVMAGDSLSQEQAEYQRDTLIRCDDPFTCPHGRPTVIEMSEGFLDKQFLRT